MSNAIDFILTVLSSVGVTTVMLSAIAWLARTWISERLRASIRGQYDEQIATLNAKLKQQGDAATTELKAEMDRFADRLKHSAQSLGEAQKAAAPQRLAAVEETWRVVLELQDRVPAGLVFLDVLLDSEYLDSLTNPKIGPDLRAIDHLPIITAASSRSRELAVCRPFLGELLWALFSTYQAATLRMIYLVSSSKNETSKLLWFKDKLIRQHIQTGLGDIALAEFDVLTIGRVSWLRDRFHRAILSALDAVIAGRELSEAALSHAERMEAHLRIATKQR